MFGDDVWRHIISYLPDFVDLLYLRCCCVYLNGLFHEWFWAPISKTIAPSHGMLYLVCDCCDRYYENLRCISLPWILFQAPVYKYCKRANCGRTVLQNVLRDAKRQQYYFSTCRFISPFIRISRRNFTVDALCSTRCIKVINGVSHVLLFYGDPLITIKKKYVPLAKVARHIQHTLRILEF